VFFSVLPCAEDQQEVALSRWNNYSLQTSCVLSTVSWEEETGDSKERIVEVGVVVIFHCPLSCRDAEGGAKTRDLLFQK